MAHDPVLAQLAAQDPATHRLVSAFLETEYPDEYAVVSEASSTSPQESSWDSRPSHEVWAAARAALDFGINDRNFDGMRAAQAMCIQATELYYSMRDPSSPWLSTQVITSERTPERIRRALLEAGHPAALVYPEMAARVVTPGAAASVFELIDSSLLTRSLWRELALEGAVGLTYKHDEKYAAVWGSTPLPDSTHLRLDAHSPRRYVIGRQGGCDSWMTTTGILPREPTARAKREWLAAAGETLENFFLYGIFEEMQKVDPLQGRDQWLDFMALAVMVLAAEEPSRGLQVTEAGAAAVAAIELEPFLSDDDVWEWDVLTEVILLDDPRPDFTYSRTSFAQKAYLVHTLQKSRTHPLISVWGLASHFLACIALHPATPEEIRASLTDDDAPEVRAAAIAGAGGAQRGATARVELERWGPLAFV
jgi:hypothetical protein